MDKQQTQYNHEQQPRSLPQQVRQRRWLSTHPTPSVATVRRFHQRSRKRQGGRIRVHRLSHANAAENHMYGGTSRAFAKANCLTMSTTLSLHLPPVFVADTARRRSELWVSRFLVFSGPQQHNSIHIGETTPKPWPAKPRSERKKA